MSKSGGQIRHTHGYQLGGIEYKRYGRGMLRQSANAHSVRRRRVAAVVPLGGSALRVQWIEGDEEVVDIKPVLTKFRRGKLAHSESLLRSARASEDGASIVFADGSAVGIGWIEDMVLSKMGRDEFRSALDELGLTIEGAAAHLGVSRRSIAGYRTGNEIPRLVALATRFLLLRRRGIYEIAEVEKQRG